MKAEFEVSESKLISRLAELESAEKTIRNKIEITVNELKEELDTIIIRKDEIQKLMGAEPTPTGFKLSVTGNAPLERMRQLLRYQLNDFSIRAFLNSVFTNKEMQKNSLAYLKSRKLFIENFVSTKMVHLVRPGQGRRLALYKVDPKILAQK